MSRPRALFPVDPRAVRRAELRSRATAFAIGMLVAAASATPFAITLQR